MFAWVALCVLGAKAQTTIVALRNSSEIVIAADSQATPEIEELPVSSACKITKIGPIIMAAAGFVELQGTNYNIRDIAASALREGGTFQQKVERFEKLMTPWLHPALNLMQKHYPNRSDEDIFRRKVEVVFAGFEKGAPILYRRDSSLCQVSR